MRGPGEVVAPTCLVGCSFGCQIAADLAEAAQAGGCRRLPTNRDDIDRLPD
jgi:hypothetical protein